MTFWFVVLVVISSSGTVHLTTHYPKSMEANSKKMCEEYGQVMSEKFQVEVGTRNAKVYWKCEEVSYETIAKSLPRT